MNTADIEQQRFDIRPGKRSDPAAVLELILMSAGLLFANGQSTRTMVATAARLALRAINRFPPVSLVRFALLAGAGAAALGVIFGATHVFSLLIIALSAGAGACLRRWLAGESRNLIVLAMAFGLILPKMGIDHFTQSPLPQLTNKKAIILIQHHQPKHLNQERLCPKKASQKFSSKP
jgi:hypothetical protein